MTHPWCKWPHDWYTDRDHLNLTFDALHLGAFLGSIAKASPEPGWLLQPNGAPQEFLALAQAAHMTGAPKAVERRMKDALAQLIGVGSLVIRGSDGAIGFSKSWWDRIGETSAAARMRKIRAADRANSYADQRNSSPNSSPDLPRTVTPNSVTVTPLPLHPLLDLKISDQTRVSCERSPGPERGEYRAPLSTAAKRSLYRRSLRRNRSPKQLEVFR